MSLNSNTELRTFLNKYFDSQEIKSLCFDLQVDYDELYSGSKSRTIISLIETLERRGQIPELVKYIQYYRPNVSISALATEVDAAANEYKQTIGYSWSRMEARWAAKSLSLLLSLSFYILLIAIIILIIFLALRSNTIRQSVVELKNKAALYLTFRIVRLSLGLVGFTFLSVKLYPVIYKYFVHKKSERSEVSKLYLVKNLKDLSHFDLTTSDINFFQIDFVRATTLDFQKELKDFAIASSNYNKLACLNRAQNLISELNVALSNAPFRNRKLERIFSKWLTLVKTETQKIIVHPKKIEDIPNPFIPGQPIRIDSETMFRGRRDIFEEIERSLTSLYQPATLVLFGPRRNGKTSLLNQLPAHLPEHIVPVFINLQEAAGTAMSVSGFIDYLARSIKDQGEQVRGVRIPKINGDINTEPYLSFSQWLKDCSSTLLDLTLFITFDEFEWVEKAMEQGKLDLQVLSFFRNLIQQNELRLAILFAGVHTLDQMKYDWPSYFINVKTIKVGNLPEADARRLITNPIPDFPLDYNQQALDFFLTETGCQPYLIQLVAFELVNYLNSSERKTHIEKLTASVDDVEIAVKKSLRAGHNYFAELWNASSLIERTIMSELALNGIIQSQLDESELELAIRYLIQKDVIESIDGRLKFQIPIVQRWIKNEKPPSIVQAEFKEQKF